MAMHYNRLRDPSSPFFPPGHRYRHEFDLGSFYLLRDNEDGTGQFVQELGPLESVGCIDLLPEARARRYPWCQVRPDAIYANTP
jgi:hypothetical protein